jgi:hypothetical protein
VLFHPEAEAELDHSIGFYEERQEGLGLDFEREVRHGIAQIHDAPSRWPIHKFGTRKFLLRRFPFYIFYLELLHMDCCRCTLFKKWTDNRRNQWSIESESVVE